MSKSHPHRVLVIGGGASGIMAALSATYKGAEVTILERNSRIGRKILATGNGRCNYTNVSTDAEYYNGENPDFIYGPLSIFSVRRTMGFFEKLGVAPRVEEAGKVFPMSDQASSVLDVLLYELDRIGVNIICNAFVNQIKKTGQGFVLKTADGKTVEGDRVVLACGGKAMPASGSDGNGYDLAKRLGHHIVDIFPALTQLRLEGDFFKQIQGVKFVGTAEILSDKKTYSKDKGDILFTNYGISGPPILQISRKVGELIKKKKDAILKVSIIDSMTQKELDGFLAKRFKTMQDRSLDFSLVGFVNKRLIPVLLKQAGIQDIRKPVHMLAAVERQKISTILTDWRFKITGLRSWPNAQVTAGGVDTNQVDPFTMESTLVKDLYFCGEILDIDGACGGFNLQWAWSSGYTAGKNAASKV